jgi:hypothetical protein
MTTTTSTSTKIWTFAEHAAFVAAKNAKLKSYAFGEKRPEEFEAAHFYKNPSLAQQVIAAVKELGLELVDTFQYLHPSDKNRRAVLEARTSNGLYVYFCIHKNRKFNESWIDSHYRKPGYAVWVIKRGFLEPTMLDVPAIAKAIADAVKEIESN